MMGLQSLNSKVAIYCLMQDEEVVYVGQSTNPSIRIYDHSVGVGKKMFNQSFVKWVSADSANYWERKAIERYQPKYNVQGVKTDFVPFDRRRLKRGDRD